MSLAVAATGLLAYTANDATDGTVVTVGTVTYTLKTGALTAAGHVAIVVGFPDKTARNLAYAVNGTGGTPGTDYSAIPANAAAQAIHDPIAKVIRFDAKVSGSAGNSVALTTNEPEFTAPGSLSGGIDGSDVVPWSFVTLDEAKVALRIRGNSADEEIVGILTEVASIIEGELLYRAVNDVGDAAPEADIDEYHDLANPQGFIYTLKRPLRSVTKLYMAGTEVPSSDYIFDTISGQITLMGSTVTRPSGSHLGQGGYYGLGGRFTDFPEDLWRFGSRYFAAIQGSARVLYKGGFAATETVDPTLKGIALDIAARIYRTRERKSQGIISEIAQGFTMASKYDMKTLNEDILRRLRPFVTLTKTART